VDEASWPVSLLESVAADVSRVADRLRSMSEARLAAPVPGYPSRAAAGRAVSQAAALAGQGVEECMSPGEPSWREVPALSDFVVGDQVAVTGRDLLAAVGGVQPTQPVWVRGGRRTALDVVTDVGVLLEDVRRLL
jgi:hypothetical protein